MILRLGLILLLLLFKYEISVSQLYTVQFPPGYNKINPDKGISEVVGSPYLSDDWSNGSVKTYNGKVIDNLSLRYNVYEKQIQFQADNNIYFLGSPDSLLLVTLDDKHFLYLSFEDKNGLQKDYFEDLSGDGEAQLLLRHTVIIIKSNYNVALNAGEKNDRLEHKSFYYIRKGSSVVLIDKKGDNLYNLLSEKSKELHDFVSLYHLSFTNKYHLKRMVEYYNSLYIKK